MREVSLSHPHIVALRKVLGATKVAPNSQVRFNSPFIPRGKSRDTKFRLYVNPKVQKYFCFRTSNGGSLSYLFMVLGEPFSDDPDLPVSPLFYLKKRAYDLTSEKRFVKPVANLPEEYEKIRKPGRVYNYLLRRGLTDDDIDYYKIGEGSDDYDGGQSFPVSIKQVVVNTG